MKIIISGATGTAGGSLTRQLSEQGHEILALGRMKKPPEKLLKFASYKQIDITEPFDLPSADLLIHAAAMSDDKGSKKDFYRTNVHGTLNTLKAAAHCDRFIHISSSSVYLPADQSINEELAGNQNNKLLSNYGYSKLEAENRLIEKFRKDSCFILRPRAHYGIGDKMILPRLLKIEKNKTLHCPGDMKINVSLTHLRNLTTAVNCCIESEKNGINIYNVSDDNSYILMDVIKKLTTSFYGYELPTKKTPIILLKILAAFKIGGITPLLVRSLTKNMVLNISKIKDELNYKPVTDLDSSLKEITDWVALIGGIERIKNAEKDLAWKI